jgi:hypothetical protein
VNGPTRYRFDASGRLAEVTMPSGIRIGHDYSINGWPIGRSRRGQSVGFSFLGDLPLFAIRHSDKTSGWFIADPLWGGALGLRSGPTTELGYRDGLGRLMAVGEAGRDSLKATAWGLFGRRSLPDKTSVFQPFGLDAVGFDSEENLSGVHDPATGLSLVPHSLRERLSPYSDGPNESRGMGILPMSSMGNHGEIGLIEEIAAACGSCRFAPDEGAILRHLLDAAGSPGWPDVGSDETFDHILDGGSFRTPAMMAREIVETILRDGTGGLSASVLAPHVAAPPSWLGLGHFRAICPTLAISPPVILEAGRVADDIWRDDPMFAAADNMLHGWIGRLIARATDRCDVRPAGDGNLRLLAELLELTRWTMNVPDRAKDENLPPTPEATQPGGPAADRLVGRDRLLKSLDQTP